MNEETRGMEQLAQMMNELDAYVWGTKVHIGDTGYYLYLTNDNEGDLTWKVGDKWRR